MNIKKGDKVRFLNDVGGGIVVSIGKNTAEVLGSDGFEIPVLLKELIKIDSSPQAFYSGKQKEATEVISEKETIAKSEKEPEINFIENEEEVFENPFDELNIYYALVPVNQTKPADSDIEAFFINDSNYFLMYNYMQLTDNKHYSVRRGVLEPNTKIVLELVQRKEVGALQQLDFQIITYKSKAFELHAPIHKKLKVNVKNLYKASSFKENDFFDEKAIIYTIHEQNLMEKAVEQLSEADIKKQLLQKNTNYKRPRQKKKVKVEEKIIDLHLHELIEDERNMSPKEKLDVQISHFHNEMKAAKEEKLKRIVFIHGVGNGTLKIEIRRLLDRKYKHLQYQDASFREYGYGATMVILRR